MMWDGLDIALIVAMFLAVITAGLVIHTLGKRALRVYLLSSLNRRVSKVQKIVQKYQANQFKQVDRLLFELGNVSDSAAVEAAFGEMLDGSGEINLQLRSVYWSLGLVDRYVKQLTTSRQWAERTQAARALGQLGAHEAIPQLVQALRDPHEDAGTVKLAAAQALGELNAPEAIPLLLKELEQPDEWASPRIAELLIAFGEEALEPLETALSNEDSTNARVWAAQILGRLADKRATHALVARLQDRSDRVRISAAEALGRLADRRAIPDLAHSAMRDPVAPVRAEAARALGSIGDESVIDELVMLLTANDYWTRLRAVEAIERLHPADLFPLERALNDDSQVVRGQAAAALERLGVLTQRLTELESDDREVIQNTLASLVRFGKAGALESLLKVTDHPDMRVRSRICIALGDVGDHHAVTSLAGLLEDAAWPVRARAVEAIGKLRPQNIADLLLPLLKDPEEMVRIAAIGALQSVGVGAISDNLVQLQELFNQGNAEVRGSVVATVKALPLEKVSSLLLQAIDDPNADVRLDAVRDITDRADALFLDALTERLSDVDTRVRNEAARALGKIASPESIRAMAESLSTPDRDFRETLTDMLAAQGTAVVLQVVGRSQQVEKRLALAWALGKTREVAALDELRRLATDPEAAVRAAAGGALSKIPGRDAQVALTKLLGDPNERVRAAAVNAIGEGGEQDLIKQVVLLCADPDPFVRNRVAIALGKIGGAIAEESLIELFEKARTPRDKAFAVIGCGLLGSDRGFVIALGQLVNPELRPHIDRVLAGERGNALERFRRNLTLDQEDPDADAPLTEEALREHYLARLRNSREPKDRLAALRALQTIGIEDAIDSLTTLLSTDPSPDVRQAAIECLSQKTKDERVPAAMRRALRDPILNVQIAAVNGLSQIADREHNQALLEYMGVGDVKLSNAIVRALARANAHEPLAFVDELMGYPDPSILRTGASVLGQIGDPRAQGVLISWLSSRDIELRQASIRALGGIGTIDAKEALIDSLEDPNEEIRLTSAETLTRMPMAGVLDGLRKLVHDPSVRVRAHLARAIGASRNVSAIELADLLTHDLAEDVRVAALISLLQIGDDGALKRMVDSLKEQPFAVIRELRALPENHAAVTRLGEMVTTHRRAEGRAFALRALGAIDKRPIDVMLKALGDPEPNVRIAAVEVCTNATEPEIREALDYVLSRDPVQKVRDAVRKGRLTVVGSQSDD